MKISLPFAHLRALVFVTVSVFIFSGSSALYAQQSTQITSLEQLLRKVKEERSREQTLNKQREAEFIAARDRQKALLRKAEAEFLEAQKQNNPLMRLTEDNRAEIKKLEETLDKEITNLGDIYGIYHEFAGDMAAVLQGSMIHAQIPERQEQLDALSDRSELPAIEDMEALWLLIQEEMTEAARVTTFQAPVLSADGVSSQQTVLRAGTFTAVSDGQLLRYIPETGELLTLSRQPREKAVAADFAANLSTSEPADMLIDPTRGALLGISASLPTLTEKIQQGKEVGYLIVVIGLAGLVIALWRLLYLLRIWAATRSQLQNLGQPQDNNPLGRVIHSARNLMGGGKQLDEETLLYKLDEAVLREIPPLEKGHGLIKLFAAVAPLMGLLGTVIGMIATFQAIALFGSGDPKLMAGGISQALVTTVLGLVVAIPLLFGHNLVAALSRSIVQILDEQSAGLLADHMEKQSSGG